MNRKNGELGSSIRKKFERRNRLDGLTKLLKGSLLFFFRSLELGSFMTI